jgi:Ser/Thr protein kinase RdoA (MazF antagonist)
MTDKPATAPSDGTSAEAVIRLLRDAYDLTATGVRRLPVGQGAVNYRVDCGHETVFAKAYPDGTDLDGERAGIAQSELAGRHGVPVARVRPCRDGDPIAVGPHGAVSVWPWVDGATMTEGLRPAQQQAAGAALGRIHEAFADHPAGRGPAPSVAAWMSKDLDGLRATIDRLLAEIAARGPGDDFATHAEHALAERREDLARVPALLAGLPALSAQVLHGDYSAVNLLFTGDDLAAVLDFRPPRSFLPAYELGRIAFDPRSVAGDPDWLGAAARLVAAYLDTFPHAKADDVRACGRVALLQLLTSLYGVKQHYLKPGLLQDDLDDFWHLRHRTARTLLARLDDVEDTFADLATARTRTVPR